MLKLASFFMTYLNLQTISNSFEIVIKLDDFKKIICYYKTKGGFMKDNNLKISVLGCGRWGSFIAWYMDQVKKYDVTVWGRENDPIVESLFSNKKNEYVEYSDSINLTHDLESALTTADIVIISISSQALDSFMHNVKEFACYTNKKFVLCMKGIDEKSGKRLSEVLIDNGVPKENIAVWVGPGHIQEFTKNVPSCMVIDSHNEQLTEMLVESFSSNLIRFYIGSDIVGTEIGAAAKNVMGVAAGMLDGLGYTVLKGALMARGAREVARLIKACGGNELSAYGLCHIGDYEATLFSQHSHNRKFGELFVKGETFSKLAEGVSTSHAMLTLAEEKGVDLPITKAVYNIINNLQTPSEILDEFFGRSKKKEFLN